MLAKHSQLLSMKDNNQTASLRALAEAGIRSFKIEGRLKDLSYVKNVTAWYRQHLDAIMAGLPSFRPASSGRCTYSFEPRPEKTFNRGATEYFVHGRGTEVAAFDTPKFAGEPVGKVAALGRDWFELDGEARFGNGDGLSWLDDRGELAGLRINRAEGRRLFVEKTRIGSTVKKKYDKAQTPYRRVLASDDVSEEDKQRLKTLYVRLNPAHLKRQITKLQDTLIRLTATKRSPRRKSAA